MVCRKMSIRAVCDCVKVFWNGEFIVGKVSVGIFGFDFCVGKGCLCDLVFGLIFDGFV